jgi:CheY-like chemotaxis protein
LGVPSWVVVVDDDEALRNAVRRALWLGGYDVDLAGDGAEALDRLAATKADLVVLDVLVPVLDGITVCHRLRGAADRPPDRRATRALPQYPEGTPQQAAVEIPASWGLASFLVTSLVLAVPLAYLILRWRLPFGAATPPPGPASVSPEYRRAPRRHRQPC